MEEPGKALGDSNDSEDDQKRENNNHLQQGGDQIEECLESTENARDSDEQAKNDAQVKDEHCAEGFFHLLPEAASTSAIEVDLCEH